MEIRAPVSGVIVKRHVTEVGAQIDVDAPLADIEEQDRPEGAKSATESVDPPAAAPVQMETPKKEQEENVVAMRGSTDITRKPSIKFRYGRANAVEMAADGGDRAAREVETKETGSAVVSEDGRKVFDFLEMPAFYGRLPPMTEDESERVLLGGAEPY